MNNNIKNLKKFIKVVKTRPKKERNPVRVRKDKLYYEDDLILVQLNVELDKLEDKTIEIDVLDLEDTDFTVGNEVESVVGVELYELELTNTIDISSKGLKDIVNTANKGAMSEKNFLYREHPALRSLFVDFKKDSSYIYGTDLHRASRVKLNSVNYDSERIIALGEHFYKVIRTLEYNNNTMKIYVTEKMVYTVDDNLIVGTLILDKVQSPDVRGFYDDIYGGTLYGIAQFDADRTTYWWTGKDIKYILEKLKEFLPKEKDKKALVTTEYDLENGTVNFHIRDENRDNVLGEFVAIINFGHIGKQESEVARKHYNLQYLIDALEPFKGKGTMMYRQGRLKPTVFIANGVDTFVLPVNV